MQKLKMSILSILLLFVLPCGLAFWWTRAYRNQCIAKPQPEPVFVFDKVCELQKMVGAKRDGVIGPETMRLVNEAVLAEEPNYCNYHAIKCIKKAL
jgi:hypothetical protein